MTCTSKEQETCDVEKRGCEGCYYNKPNLKELSKRLMLYNLKRMNAELDYILSGEWRRHEQSRKKKTRTKRN